MPPLATELRRDLERAVSAARQTAEAGAQNALVVLGVADDRAPDGLTAEDRALRVALRAQARSLGGGLTFDGLAALREEIAYGAWHRMLFARFLAENGLLVEPSSGAPVSLADVAELAQEKGEADAWVLAARYAAAMLPGIFGTVDPTTRVAFSPDDRLRLETILRGLPDEVFTADDALGWVYQFWQSKRKDQVNAAAVKIGGADLAAVTQLFTEHYMVRFLLENSLGAWWASRHPDSHLLREWEYLRFDDDGTPAAGTFDGWPTRAAEVTVMDPCMGSGHFLVAAADMLRKMRMEEEGIDAETAAEIVIRDNLFGLELDPRCTQLGAFALAFDAWKAAGGYRELPVPNIACSGIAVKGQLDDWRRLAGSDTQLRAGLERLYELFQDAPELGSLIDPRSAAGVGLWTVNPEKLLATLDQALLRETEDPTAKVFGAAAQGTAKAARLLAGRYWLVATNPPFLGSGAQPATLRRFVEREYAAEKNDLAVAMLSRWRTGTQRHGTWSWVLPQAWMYLRAFQAFRRELLPAVPLGCVARLGQGAFSAIGGGVVNVSLVVGHEDVMRATHSLLGLDASESTGPIQKADWLRTGRLFVVDQMAQLKHEFAAVLLESDSVFARLTEYADVHYGSKPGQTSRVTRSFWEIQTVDRRTWVLLESTPDGVDVLSGKAEVSLAPEEAWRRGIPEFGIRGRLAWGRQGVIVSKMDRLSSARYCGQLFDDNTYVVVPRVDAQLPALLAYMRAPEFRAEVRKFNQKLVVDTVSLAQVPFDVEHWTKVAVEQYPNGLPEPQSDDPTQWLFKGGIVGSEAPLQVAVARLLGYRWPDQESDELDAFADPDGIVCLPPVSGEGPAAERLEELLAAAYGADWSAARRGELLAAAGGRATTLDAWLRDEFFEQHARQFHNRPFMWQVWDGRRDGFSALLHYHRLDRATLEKLTYSQLGDWLERQRAGIAAGETGAEARLTAATELQRALANILEGEPPYDIYVRWKSLAEQPIGWEPDLDDGVRLNVRPFVAAGILRARFTINWNKDRGNNPDGSERLNDLHFTVAEKRAARQ